MHTLSPHPLEPMKHLLQKGSAMKMLVLHIKMTDVCLGSTKMSQALSCQTQWGEGEGAHIPIPAGGWESTQGAAGWRGQL